MNKCEYGCGQEGIYKLKNGKFCCSEKFNSCPEIKRKNSETNKIKQLGKNNGMYGKKQSIESRRKNSESNKRVWKDPFSTFNTKEYRTRLKRAMRIVGFNKKRSIEYIKDKYKIFSKIEEMRYNPDKPEEKEIQVRCKNHNCPNSKEKGGWFTPTNTQLYERIRNIERHGVDNSYFYCSTECKDIYPLFNLHFDPNKKELEGSYKQQEYQIFRLFVLERDNYICQYCGEKAEHVHHERPQKLEPFFSLDPDYAWAVCSKCHYEKGHKDECSTGKLANQVCMETI